MHTILSRRNAHLLVIAALLAVAPLSPMSAAAAPGDVYGYVGACAIIEDPTPTVHTECPNMDLRMSVGMVGGADLDYANFEGSNLAGSMLLVAASSANHMRLAGADLTGTTIGFNLDLTGGSLKGALLDGAMLMTANLSGLDLSGTDFSGANLHDSNLRNTDLSGTVFSATSTTGGVSIAGAVVDGAVLPVDLDGGDQSGVDFSTAASIPAGSHYKGANLSGSVFDGAVIADFNIDGSNASDTSFADVSFAAGGSFSARGVNFIRSDFSGVDFTPLAYTAMDGSPLAFADLSGGVFRLAPGGYYADANLAGSTLFGNGSGAVFHRASLVGAIALEADAGSGAPLVLNGAQFHDADATDVDFDNTSLNGAQFYRTTLVRAKLQSAGVIGISGLVIVDSDLTDAQLPPAKNLNGWDSQKWLYGQFIQGSTIDGTGLANDDVVATAAAGSSSTAVAIPLPAAFQNSDGQLPYGSSYDGNYWWGARYSCDHESGDSFPVGVTTVQCELRFENAAGGAPVWLPPIALDLSTSIAYDPFDSASYGYGVVINGQGAPAKTAIAANPSWPAGIDEFNVDEYKYLPRFITTDAGIYTVSTTSFTVTVTAPPAITGTYADGLAGSSYSSSPTVAGYPTPTVALTAGTLPAGLTLGTDGRLSGTPAAGAGGRYDITIEASNSSGTAELEQTLWIVSPAVELEHGTELHAGDQVDVTGTGFTPGGDVEVWLHSTPRLVTTVTADANGNVRSQVSTSELGTHHVELVDVTTGAVAVSAAFTVTGAGLAFTGVSAAALAVLAALLLGPGTVLAIASRRRRLEEAPSAS